MFGARDRESPAERRKREKEELTTRTMQLLHLIEDHLTQAHPMRHRHTHRKPDGSVGVTVLRDSVNAGGSGIKGKERERALMMSRSGRNLSRSDSSFSATSMDSTRSLAASSSSRTQVVCHVGEMIECVEQLNLQWDRVVVFGGKEEIQETFLSLPVIEILLRLLKRHPESAALHARCAQFLTPLVTENMDAKIRVERAKGVRVFGLAYQQFGPWARTPPKAQPVLGLESGGQTAIIAEGMVQAIATTAAGTGGAWAANGGEIEKATAEAEAKKASDVREIRVMLEKHSAFDTILNLFFALTKSIATCASQYPDEEQYLQRLKQKVNKVLYRPQLVERRLLFLNRHILGYNLLWGGIKAEYDKMRKEFSYLHLVSLPTGHVEPSVNEAALPLLAADAYAQPSASPRESEHHDDALSVLSSSGVTLRNTGSGIGTSIGGSGIGASSSGSTGLKDSHQRAKTERERKNKLIKRKTKEMLQAEIREQKLEQVLCHVQLMEVKIDKLSPDVDEDGFPMRARNPFVVIQQWRWKEAPGRNQPALWKSTIQRNEQSPVWDLRPLGTKESGYVLTPRQGTGHRVRRVLSGLVYRRNPLAKAISHFQLWKKKRKANKKKKKAEAFSTTRAVGVAADDYSTLKASGGRKLKSHKPHRHHPGHSQSGVAAVTETESDDEHQHHHNPKHLPKRVKHYVKEHHQKHVEEPRDTAITTVVRDMHNRFRARFFPPLKVSVYDWVAVDQQEFLGRVEIDPAVVYLLEREVAEGRKRASMSGVTTEGLARANAADVARENARLSNRGRRGSFLREMIDTDMETDEDEEQEPEPDAESIDFGDDVIADRKAKEAHENYDNPETASPREGDQVEKNEDEEKEQARQENINEKQEDKEEERNREVRDIDEDRAQRRNEKERLQERADIRRAAGSPEELERLNSTDSSHSHHSEHEDHQPQPDQKQHEPTQMQKQQDQHQQQERRKSLDANKSADVVEGKEARRREKQKIERERKERKEAEKRERDLKKKDEQDRKRLEQERKRRARKMSKAGLQVEDATVEKGVEEEQRGITVVLPLYAGEEERNTPGLERHHAGLSGHISITLTVSPPHWAADCATLSDQPLPV